MKRAALRSLRMTRRRFLAIVAGALASSVALLAVGQRAPRRIVLTAARFEFTPAEISIQRGVPLTLVLRSLDFAHGFSLPDFGLRRDFVPSKDTELTFTPDKAGRFQFACDNFCGEGHDDMDGWLIVTPS